MTIDIDDAINALLAYQQADMEGTVVLTSRQAIHEVADELRRMRDVAQGAVDPLTQACRVHVLEMALREIRRYSDENLGPSRSSLLNKIAHTADVALDLATQPPAAPVETLSPEQWVDKLREGTEFAETPLSRCSAGTEPTNRQLHDAIATALHREGLTHSGIQKAVAAIKDLYGALPQEVRICPDCGRPVDGPTHAAYCPVSRPHQRGGE